MNRKLATIIGIQAFLIVVLFWVLVFYGKDEYEASSQESEDSIEAPNHVNAKAGVTVISLSTATQAQSEIKTTALQANTHQTSLSTYGNVIGIDNLTELRTRYLAAKAEADILQTNLTHSKIEYDRQYSLNLDDKNVSDKTVASALATIKADEAKVFAAESSAKNIADSMRQLWGEALTEQATRQNSSTLLHNLLNFKDALIQITLPFDSSEPNKNSRITVSPIAAPSHTISAYFISRAPLSNATIQGKTYFYHATSEDLRAGMQVKILSTSSKGSVNGVTIPSSAVVWYAGKPWVYQKIGVDQFSRLPINTDVEVENGWFYQGKLKPNDQVVTNGAQLLLSEEFKSQIKNENED
ncbi:hypothetical protein GALL_133940 [mine drainage metagenome]|uniref:Uncharacterized protein n=1 Tax=mine drainage metagenome TaxID=410659 RepID=A0A1J5S829_9ZZZZ